ncbi:hypothetical protein ACIP79_24205 [Streptomyces sp. NPDC088747]|uniref:hypothetical protein n=1 Tax=Streptomyces sp. NPDC088747 TaxID=3365886 RepID=UPI003820C454
MTTVPAALAASTATELGTGTGTGLGVLHPDFGRLVRDGALTPWSATCAGGPFARWARMCARTG